MHPNERPIREACAAFGRGDRDGDLRAYADDFVVEAPGRNALSGTSRRRDGLAAIARTAMEIPCGAFKEEGRTCSPTTATASSWPVTAACANARPIAHSERIAARRAPFLLPV